MNNKPYLLALNRISMIGPRTIMKLSERWPCLEDMFNLSRIALGEAGLPAKLADAIHGFNMAEVDADLNWEKADNHHVLTWEDSN
jgi:DNA processing protein